MTNKAAIIQCIVLHNALNKLRVHLDTFSAGLEVMGVKELITLFPNVMKPLLVYGVTRAHDVVRMLRPHPAKMNKEELRVWQFLLEFINGANEEGI